MDNFDKNDMAPYLAKMELLIDELVRTGTMPRASLDDIKNTSEREHYERNRRFRKAAYQNTRLFLKKFHSFKHLKQEWIDELASEVDMPLPYNIKELNDVVKDIIMFEKKGHEKLKRMMARINQSCSEIGQIESSIKILKARPSGQYSYFLIRNAFIDSKVERSTEEQLKALQDRYKITLSKTVYYEHLKKAVEELSLIAFNSNSEDNRLVNMIASVMYASNEIYNMEKSLN